MWVFQVKFLSKYSPKNLKLDTSSMHSEFRVSAVFGILFLVKNMALDLGAENLKPHLRAQASRSSRVVCKVSMQFERFVLEHQMATSSA